MRTPQTKSVSGGGRTRVSISGQSGQGQPGYCYKWALSEDAPAIPWTALGFTPLSRAAPHVEEASGPTCYRQVEDGGLRWVLEGGREAQCFQMDSCYGGMGELEDGLAPCFKWAIGPDAPALTWSATLTNPQLAADIPPPEEIYEGSFEMTSDSCSENCDPVFARVIVDTPIYASADATAPLVGTISAGECAVVEDYRLRSAPRRGVVLETHGQFTAGDVIYYLASAGEGHFSAWRRGESMEAEYDVVVRWDAPPEIVDPRIGYWLELTRSNGTSGWARRPETSEDACTFVRR